MFTILFDSYYTKSTDWCLVNGLVFRSVNENRAKRTVLWEATHLTQGHVSIVSLVNKCACRAVKMQLFLCTKAFPVIYSAERNSNEQQCQVQMGKKSRAFFMYAIISWNLLRSLSWFFISIKMIRSRVQNLCNLSLSFSETKVPWMSWKPALNPSECALEFKEHSCDWQQHNMSPFLYQNDMISLTIQSWVNWN